MPAKAHPVTATLEQAGLKQAGLKHAGLEQAGLSISQVLGLPSRVTRASRNDGCDVSMMMRNDVQFSKSTAPSIPVATGRLELIRVELRGDVLTIADIWGSSRDENGVVIERVGARLYGIKTVALDGVTTYMLLTKLPTGVADEKFFPAEGTAVLFDDLNTGPRVLKACGFDRNTGQAQGWIFHAMET
jgi:hypothetical protein